MLKKLIACFCFVAMLTMTAAAMPNWLGELQERVENSPMEAIVILAESLVNGVVEVEVNDVDWRGNPERTMMRLYSNLRNTDYALFMENLDRWGDNEVDLLFNRQRVALRVVEDGVGLLGDNLLGVTFATFGADLNAFLNSLYNHGLIWEMPAASEIEMAIRYVGMVSEFLNSGHAHDINPLQFADLFLLFMLGIQQETAQDTITFGGELVSVQRNRTFIRMNTVYDMLINLIDRVDTGLMRGTDFEIFAWLLEEARDGLSLERDHVDGYIFLDTYTEANGRVRRLGFGLFMHCVYYFTGYTLDFGAHALDTWVWTLSTVDSWSSHLQITEWEVCNTGELRAHRFATTENRTTRWLGQAESHATTTAITISWNPTTGHLSATVKEDGRWGIFEETVEGTLTFTDSGFILKLADEDASITFSATVGTPVPRPAFINLDRWADVAAIRGLFGVNVVDTVTIELTPIPIAVVANCHALYLRRGPGVSHAAFNHLPAGYILNVLEVRGNWVKVYTSRGTGWVFGRYLEFYVSK